MENEIWKPVRDSENYLISNKGNLYSKKRGKVLTAKPRSDGYKAKVLYENGEEKLHYYHIMVAKAFIPNPHNYPCVNHINEDKGDNRVENLEWCDYTYNNNYGKHNKKMSHTKSKAVRQTTLNGEFVAEYYGAMEAYRQTGISQGNISACCRGIREYAGGYKWQYI